MTNILAPGSGRLAPEFTNFMFGGNSLWADPEDARRAGVLILDQLIERYGFIDSRDESPSIQQSVVLKMLKDVLFALDYAGLPTERRANVFHGLIDAMANAGVLGGEPEWVQTEQQQQGVKQ
jgi:hypothetical protein